MWQARGSCVASSGLACGKLGARVCGKRGLCAASVLRSRGDTDIEGAGGIMWARRGWPKLDDVPIGRLGQGWCAQGGWVGCCPETINLDHDDISCAIGGCERRRLGSPTAACESQCGVHGEQHSTARHPHTKVASGPADDVERRRRRWRPPPSWWRWWVWGGRHFLE